MNRIREDTAKYLRNLDTNSAYYDPKTRSMRENPTPNKDVTDVRTFFFFPLSPRIQSSCKSLAIL